eukprot:126195_1
MPVLTRSQRKRKFETVNENDDASPEPPRKKHRPQDVSESVNENESPSLFTAEEHETNKENTQNENTEALDEDKASGIGIKQCDKMENDDEGEDKEESKESVTEPFESFIEELKRSYVTSEDCETGEDEKKIWSLHNTFEQHLYNAAQQISTSNTLSSDQKWRKRKTIGNVIKEYFQKLTENLDNIPDELNTNNDGSVIMESALKSFRPSHQRLVDLIYRLHSGKLTPSNTMHVMFYTMQSFMSYQHLREIVQAYYITCNLLNMKCGFLPNDQEENEDDHDGDESDETKIKSETKQIVQLLEDNVFGTNAKDDNLPSDCSKNVRFDDRYCIRKYFVDKTLENLYCGKLQWESGFSVGSDYSIDCAGDLFAVTGGSGWKYRDPVFCNYWIDPASNEAQVVTGGNMGFSSPGWMVFCDTIHSRFWNSGDHRVKCTLPVENGKLKRNEKEALRCEYILDISAIPGNNKRLFTTQDHVFVYSSRKGAFFQWTLNNLNKHKTDYCVEAGDCGDDDDDIPDVDEHGIETVKSDIMENTSSDLEFVKVEVSGGQKYENVFAFKEFAGTHSSISGSIDDGDVSNMFLSDDNVIYSYDMNQQTANGILLGHHSDVFMPFRQHLLDKHMLISYDYGIVKVWDTRTCSAEISIKGSGSDEVNCGIGFDICGHPFVVCGGRDECVTVWDIRKVNTENNAALYEITTGNNMVCDMTWHKASKSLFVATECLYIDRLGGRYYGLNHDKTDDMFGCQDDENDWPMEAKHKQKDFPSGYDAGMNNVFRYRFH